MSADDLHSTAHVVDDLLPGSSYQFRVAAVNAIGNSQFSKPSAIVTVASDPGGYYLKCQLYWIICFVFSCRRRRMGQYGNCKSEIYTI